MDFSILGQNKSDVNDTADDEGEWYINENLELSYFSACASVSISSDTSTKVDDDVWPVIIAFTSLKAPIKSSHLTEDGINDVKVLSLIARTTKTS